MKKGKTILPALLAAALLTSGGVLGVDAATLNGKTIEGEVTNEKVVEAGSGKLLVGQGNLDVQTDASVGGVLNQLPQTPGAGDVLNALAPTKDNAPLIGVIGGEGHLDAGTNGLLSAVVEKKDLINLVKPELGKYIGYVEKVQQANTAGANGAEQIIEQSINATIGGKNNSNPLIIGYVGGDAAINAGLTGNVDVSKKVLIFDINLLKWSADAAQATNLNRVGNITGTLNSGNVLLGSGSSAALSIGNISISKNPTATGTVADLVKDLDLSTNGVTKVTLTGDVAYDVKGTANLGVWANGGAAVALGGTSTSTVTGTSTLNIDHTGLDTKQIDGVTGMVAGGGASVSTLGGTAKTETGDTTISINNALTGLVAGGGAAVSLDATAVYNNLTGRTNGNGVGNDDGTSDTPVSIADIKITNANQGGTATATTGNTNIELKGNSTSLITAGGGVAGAWHSYTNRDSTNGTADNGQPGGTAHAEAHSDNVKIDVDLTSNVTSGADIGDGVKNAVSTIKTAVSKGFSADILTDLGGVAQDLSGKGMAVGILGGGVAASVSDGGTTTSSTVKEVTIGLSSGYAVGTFGGGLSANVYNKSTASAYDYKDTDDIEHKGQMKSETSAEKVTINVKTSGDNDKAIGVFAGGVAVSSEYGWKHDESLRKASESLSVSKVNGDASITVEGKADGVFGGGLAVGNSNVTDTGADALASVGGTSSITVNGGTVENLNLEPIMKATQNDNKDEWPQWNMLGYNASGTMVNLKGITDHTAIAGGGMALGMSAKAENNEVNIAVNGGTVNGDILGGGIAVDQLNKGDKADNGAQVGKSTITLSGGKVEGSVYAGGAINQTGIMKEPSGPVTHGYTSVSSSKVGTSSVTLSGTEVTGEISGQGYEVKTKYEGTNYNPYYGDNGVTYEKSLNKGVEKSTLTLSGDNTLSALDATKGQYTSTAKIHDFNTVTVKAGSVTKVSGDYNTNTLIDGGKVTVAEGAKLDISDAKNGTVKIAANTAEGSTFWTNDALLYDRLAGYADGTVQTGDAGFSISYTDITQMTDEQKDKAAQEFGDAMGAGPLYPVILDGYNKGWDTTKITSGSKQFFQDWNDTKPTFNAAYGRAALLGEDAAVTGNTLSLAREMAEAGAERFSFKSDDEKGVPAPEGGLWAKYLHHKYSADGLSSVFGDIQGDSTYDGAMIGVDFKKEGKFQTGAAVHYGSGDGSGAISQNDFDAYGFTLFGSMKDEAAGTNLLADIGYTKTSNDITGHVNGKTLTADRDVTAWTVGLRGEKEYVSGKTQVVPYAGLRYVSLNPSAYDSYYGGQKLFHNDADNQSLWLLPVGVSFKTDIAAKNGWTFAPKAELAYIWAFGDKDTDVDVSISGDASAPLSYTVADDSSWLASLGIEARKDVWTFGAGYAYQKGDDSKSEKWYVNAAYAF